MRYIFLMLFAVMWMSVSAQQKKAVFIIVDGIPADLIEKLPTPALDSIAGPSGYKRALVGGEKGGYTETPTISAVGYNTVLTGTWVNKHNVWGNYGKDIANPNYHYKTIFRVFKDAYPQKKIGIFSSWLDNRTKLVGDSLAATNHLKFDFTFDGLELDTIKYPNDTTSIRMHHIDEAVVTEAASVIKEDAPDLSWVYLEYTDDMGHTFGDGPQFYDAIKNMDNQMSRIWSSVQERKKKFGEDWLVVITTDHGRDSATGMHHGGQSAREKMGWIVTNAKDLNEHWKNDTVSIADIMPSIARFLQVKIPKEELREIDGVPFNGKIGASDLKAHISNGQVDIKWKSTMKSGKAKVWVTTTNNFKTGGKDEYKLVGEFPLAKQSAKFSAPQSADGFYKIILETPYNTINRWVVPAK